MKLIHPYTHLIGGQWLRGNLHCHSTRSDGTRDPQIVIDDYAGRGYDFLMLSDHDVWSTDQLYRELDNRGLVLICGNEISAGGTHTLHVAADRHVAPSTRRQEVLNAINAGDGFAVICHPNGGARQSHCTLDQLREWVGYLGLEIFNGSPRDGSPYATGKWDVLLADGRRVWGFANDDCHRGDDDIEHGWNIVYAHQRTAAGVLDALRAGRFYASTGVTIRHIEVEGNRVRLETDNAHRIVAIMNTGKRFAIADDHAIDAIVPSAARYVRFECYGVGERVAWTQPFVVDRPAPNNGRKAQQPERTFIGQWQVSPLHANLPLADAEPVAPQSTWTEVASHTQGPNRGFTDVRKQIEKRAGVVYFDTVIDSPRAQRGKLHFGYDGPIRVWLNAQRIFEGPGDNPAVADTTALFADLERGPNRLTVALDTNNGQACGIYGRVEIDSPN